MSTIDWQTLFPTRSRQEWVQKIASDYKGAFSEEILKEPVGEGVHAEAALTGKEIASLPHLDPSSIYNSLAWKRSPGWSICAPLSLSRTVSETIELARLAIKQGAESLLITHGNTPSKPLSNADVQALATELSLEEIPVHFRLSPESSRAILAQQKSDRAAAGSFAIYTISPSSENRLPLPQEIEPDGRVIQWSIPPLGTTEESAPGRALISLRKSIERAPSLEQAVGALLPRLFVVCEIGPLFFPEIARLRALRYLLARFVKELHPDWKDPLDIPIFAEIPALATADNDPANALLKSTTPALAAVVAGCDTLLVHSRHGASLHEERRLKINTQLILRHEAQMGRVIDPGAGSYHIEWLTHQFIEQAWHRYEQAFN